jgi:hypothetical protein
MNATPLLTQIAQALKTCLADVVTSKRAADRPQDRAVLQVLERTLNEKAKAENGEKGRAPGGK